tara:strand:+ start:87 stop:365 length:279 start_codon:yes stop_codon:yes gene_type:complete
MCLASSPVVYPEVSGTRDTSNELIKSDYELSEENKKKNAEIMAAKNKAKSLVDFSDNDDGPPTTGGTVISGSSNYGSGRGTTSDAYGGGAIV